MSEHLKSAYRLGDIYALGGGDEADCPYSLDSEPQLYAAWRIGWRNQRDEQNREHDRDRKAGGLERAVAFIQACINDDQPTIKKMLEERFGPIDEKACWPLVFRNMYYGGTMMHQARCIIAKGEKL
jgi:hypothetical protein